MPAIAVRSQSKAAATIERILKARSYWKVSAMALTHRLHELELLSDWQYRATCITLSERGYRKQEPGGIVPETLRLLRKAIYGTDASLRVRDVAAALDLNAEEVRDFLGGRTWVRGSRACARTESHHRLPMTPLKLALRRRRLVLL